MRKALLALLLVTVFKASSALASGPDFVASEMADPAAVLAAWSGGTRDLVQPFPLPRGREIKSSADSSSKQEAMPSVLWLAEAPRALHRPEPFAVRLPRTGEEANALENLGTGKLPFTSSRLVPLGSEQYFPFSTVGRLEFLTPAGPAHCTGAVVNRRIVLTAGHCVHSGKNGANGFYTNFVFYPAYRDGEAPLGVWPGAYIVTTAAWATGGGKLPNAGDFAAIELADLQVNGTATRIGQVTGWLGTATGKLAVNHVTMLGYPGKFDGGELVHVVGSGTSKQNGPSYYYGSDMTQGSSGGPWVQNLGVPSVGQTTNGSGAPNLVVGVTSYGPTTAGVFMAASSTPDVKFSQLLAGLCAHRAGNCS